MSRWKEMIGPGVWLFLATTISNVCNVFFHIVMVRYLPPDQYALLVALVALMTVMAVPSATIQTTTSHRVSQLSAREAWPELRVNLRRRLVGTGLVAIVGFFGIAASRHQITRFLQVADDPAIIVIWGGAVALAVLVPITWGALQGLQAFASLGASLVVSTALKLVLGVSLVAAGYGVFGAVQGMVLATGFTFGLALIQLRWHLRLRHRRTSDEIPWWTKAMAWVGDGLSECWLLMKRPWNVSGYPFVVALSVTAYTSLTNMDVVLAKHFCDPQAAGHYAVGAMVARTVLFLPMALAMVLFPKVTEIVTTGGDAKPLLRNVMLATAGLSGAACTICLLWPTGLMRVITGSVLPEAIPIIRWLAVAMACLAIANLALVYILAAQQMWATLPYIAGAITHVALINVWHAHILQIAWVTFATGGLLALYALLVAR